VGVGDFVNFTDLSSGAPVSWAWTFEGGTPASSTEQNPVVQYNTAGTFDVTLVATNSHGSDDKLVIDFITVTVPPPVANFTADETTIFMGESVSFHDNSQYCTTDRTWVFNGGIADLTDPLNPVVTYDFEGVYDVSLTVENNFGTTDTETKTGFVTVLDPANITYCESYGDAGYEYISKVTVGDDFIKTSGSSGIVGYEDFTGGTPVEVNPGSPYTITLTPGFAGGSKFEYWGVWIDYNRDGDFSDLGEQVFTASKNRLTVSGNVTIPTGLNVETTMRVAVSRNGVMSCGFIGLGEVEDYKIIIGTPGPVPPVADFNMSINCLTADFTDQSIEGDGSITDWIWDFGDNSTSNAQNPVHSYNQAGPYDVTLTVIDINDQTDTKVQSIVIEAQIFYQDDDGDGYGNPDVSTEACDQPEGYVANSNDCDDSDAGINPEATEVCDGVDNNCDGQIDEGVSTTYYADSDGDGFGDPNVSTEACDQPEGYVANSNDCDDSDAGINPEATELCDGIDNNCNGSIDEGFSLNTYYADDDGDTYGDPENSVQACQQPSGYVLDNTDCDDNDASVNPAATEVCFDGIDNNCDGTVDEGCGGPLYCEPDNINSIPDYIQTFTLNGEGMGTSGGLGYLLIDYTLVALVPGSSSSVFLDPFGDKNRNFWRIWLDFNRDGDFDDSDETLLIANNQKGPFTTSIQIPTYATGQTRMRLTMKTGKTPSSCDDNFDGEVVDYLVDFGSGKSGQVDLSNSMINKSFRVYPNPTSDLLFIDINNWKNANRIRLIELTGKTLIDRMIDSNLVDIDLSQYPKGIYFLELSDGINVKYAKISKQ
jgi:PKD repeat protein